MLKIGSLFTGYSGLDMAVEQLFDAKTVWVSDIEKGPSRLLAHHYPDTPNLGDITKINWADVEPVDIITGGSPCFTAGTPVLTRRGLVGIEEVTTDDEVWTHEGRWRAVTATMSRTAEEVVEFRPGFYSTPEHRLLMRKPTRKWDNAVRQYRRRLEEPDWVEAQDSRGLFAGYPASVDPAPHDKPDTLTWWQVGRFLADGFTNGQVNVYIGRAKREDIEAFPGWRVTEQETAIRLTMPRSSAERDWLNLHFGKGAAGKTLPAFALGLPREDRQELLEGYWSGDGYGFGNRSKRSASVSGSLTIGIQLLAISCGYTATLHYNRTPDTTVIEGREVNQRDWWSVTATPNDGRYADLVDGFLWQKVRKDPPRVEGPVTVYDIEVDEDHSFIAAGIIVHNCQDVSQAGARKGMSEGTRSNLWVAMREAVSALRPRYVVWENVRGALSARADSDMGWTEGLLDDRPAERIPTQEKDHSLRALGRVLGDLADLGYDASWTTVPASAVGAPHKRERVFVLAWDQDAPHPPGE